MFNTKRIGAFAFLILLVIIVIVLAWWWFLRPSASPPEEQPPALIDDRVILQPQQPTVLQKPVERSAPPTDGELEVMSLARYFTERYGSFSTESGYQNLVDLFPSVTARLESDFRQTIAESASTSVFRGVDTKVVKIEIEDLSASSATALVTAQRVTTNEHFERSSVIQEIRLTMVQSGGYWQVDSAEWQ